MSPRDVNGEDRDPINDKPMPLLDHLIELRRRLMYSAIAFGIAFALCYHFSGRIYLFLAEPLAHIMRARGEQPHVIYTALYEAFFTYIRVAVFGAFFLAFPVIATQLYLFIAPGLYRSEKRAFLPFLLATPILFFAGAALAYYFVFPIAWKFFLSFETSGGADGLQIQLQAKVSEYLALVMKLILAFGIAFQLPVALTLLAKVGLVTSAQLKKLRRYAYVGAFVVAAVLTPPDVITQTGLALPLILLYEISIISARMVAPRPAEEESERAAAAPKPRKTWLRRERRTRPQAVATPPKAPVTSAPGGPQAVATPPLAPEPPSAVTLPHEPEAPPAPPPAEP